jgi:hypothetical protein
MRQWIQILIVPIVIKMGLAMLASPLVCICISLGTKLSTTHV